MLKNLARTVKTQLDWNVKAKNRMLCIYFVSWINIADVD